MPTTLPVGSVQPFAGDVTSSAVAAYLLTKGFLPCIGGTVPVSQYPDLYAAIGNLYGGDAQNLGLPDLRGYFVMGVDDRTPGTGPVGSVLPYTTAAPRNAAAPFTTDQQGLHQHTADNMPTSNGECLICSGWDNAMWNANQLEFTGAAGAHNHTVASGGDTETRPANVNVDYIIKAVNN